MQNQLPVLDYQTLMMENCRDVLRDKIQMITNALALQGKFKRTAGYDPLAGALTQLTIVGRKLNPDDFDTKAYEAAINTADDRWWEWYDNRPRGLEVPFNLTNYALRREDRLALREELRAKYAVKVEVML